MALRVGLLHYTAPPVVGGVETVIGHHARLMAAAGHRVRVIAGRGGPVGAGVEVVRLPLADTRHPEIRALRADLEAGDTAATFDTIADRLAGDLRRAADGLDVLLVHNVCSLHLNLALTAAVRRLVESGAGPGIVAWHHDVSGSPSRPAPVVRRGTPWDLLRDPWPGVTHIAISEARRDDVAATAGVPPGSVRVIPNGIDLEASLGLHPTTRRLAGALGLLEAGPILLTPARILPRKNLELGIRILAELRRDADARLLLTAPPDPHDSGAAAHLGRLRALATDLGVAPGVHFLGDSLSGSISPTVVADLYRLSDALLLTSRDEGFGLPVLEAAACRLPVVCADLPALRELARGDATYFGPDAAPAEVADAIRERLGADPASRLAARVRARFGWASIYRTRIEPLLLELAAAGLPEGGGPASGRPPAAEHPPA